MSKVDKCCLGSGLLTAFQAMNKSKQEALSQEMSTIDFVIQIVPVMAHWKPDRGSNAQTASSAHPQLAILIFGGGIILLICKLFLFHQNSFLDGLIDC